MLLVLVLVLLCLFDLSFLFGDLFQKQRLPLLTRSELTLKITATTTWIHHGKDRVEDLQGVMSINERMNVRWSGGIATIIVRNQ